MRKLSCEEQLAQVNKEFEDFIYIVSHDFKAPIRAVNNLSGWIAEDMGENLPAEVQQNLTLLRNRTHRMEQMMNAILHLSRITRYDLEIREIQVPQYLAAIKSTYEEPGISIQISTNNFGFSTYYKKLQFVLEELIQNAIAFTDKPATLINIYAEEKENSVIFRVQDNGPGIIPGAIDKIFTMFYTGRSKDENEKMGVGLALVKRVVDFAGGTVQLETGAVGQCVFLVEWPKMLN